MIGDGAGPRRFGDGVVELREATRGDAPDLYRWRMEESARPMFRRNDVIPYADHLAFLDRYFSAENRDRWFVVESEGRAVGAIALYDLAGDGSSAEWGRFVLEPAARGRGLGRRALRLLVEHARGLGVRRLRCEVRAGNPAERLYRELGFADDDDARVGLDAADNGFVKLVAHLEGKP